MSFNRLNYDTCEYKQTISQSVGPGDYQLNTPPISCEPCYPYPPSIRLQRSGNSVDLSKYMIDIDSELLNITRPYSKCSSKKYVPTCPECSCTMGEPCGQGVGVACKSCKTKLKPGQRCGDEKLHNWKDCTLPTEETRTSNPPCNLRGTGINRWEWLCLNPQERVEEPFDSQIQTRILVKDNHRPCIPTPIDPVPVLPKGGEMPCETFKPTTCAAPTHPPSVYWKNLNDIKHY